MTFQELQAHQHQAHAIAREALKTIAVGSGLSYQVVSKMFRDGDEETTFIFWDLINQEHPDQFNRVYYCQTCKKFNLYWEPNDHDQDS
jgi:hypothetical protein